MGSFFVGKIGFGEKMAKVSEMNGALREINLKICEINRIIRENITEMREIPSRLGKISLVQFGKLPGMIVMGGVLCGKSGCFSRLSCC
ncbi:hypothetical protein PH210_18030 [Paenibacillus sp. BSR1-1]|uniref:hypothetical protein n=1 Tax=Paenibacillus sp. BSR1-1 TaxID=3020845 RepID=UPI0025B0E5AC|nr:hypothetical protein [Paenibacillus sp. BSR1-1]MDN3018099.1 hypothetical protein [Paenibacillus sp. BSR1-1]